MIFFNGFCDQVDRGGTGGVDVVLDLVVQAVETKEVGEPARANAAAAPGPHGYMGRVAAAGGRELRKSALEGSAEPKAGWRSSVSMRVTLRLAS